MYQAVATVCRAEGLEWRVVSMRDFRAGHSVSVDFDCTMLSAKDLPCTLVTSQS